MILLTNNNNFESIKYEAVFKKRGIGINFHITTIVTRALYLVCHGVGQQKIVHNNGHIYYVKSQFIESEEVVCVTTLCNQTTLVCY